jgi:hypothetical protein
VTVGGTVRNYPLFDFVGTVAKVNSADYNRRWQVIIAWRSEFPGEDSMGNGYPIDIANDSLNTSAEVTATRMQADGDDLRVYVDGVEFPRLLDGINTTTTKVWVPIHFSPGKNATIVTTTGASSIPANGESMAVNEDLTGWPERGYFKIENECMWYGSRTTDTFENIKRGVRGTSGAIHSSGVRLDWVEHDIQIISNYTAAANPPVPLLAITPTSTNLAHTYPGGGTGTWVGATAQRYGQMRAKYTADNVRASGITLGEGATLLMVEQEPTATYYPYNNAELYVPCGVKAAASALAFDITDSNIGGASGVVGSSVVLNGRVFGVDAGTGIESLLAAYDRPNRGTGKTITPGAVLNRIRLNAIYVAITGAFRPGAVADFALSNVGHGGNAENAQGFTLDQDTTVENIAWWAAESASGDTRTAITWIRRPGSSSAPDGVDEVVTRTIANAKFSTTAQWVYTDSLTGGGNRIASGSKFAMIVGDATNAGTLSLDNANKNYARGNAWAEAASVWTDLGSTDFAFLLLGDGSVVQPEAPSNLRGYIQWDNLTVTFDDTNLRTPSIFIAPQEAIYIHRQRIIHEDTSDNEFTVFYIAAVGQEITVDARRKEVIIDDARGIYAPGAVTPFDPEQWYYNQANNSAVGNTFRVVDPTINGGGTLTAQQSRNDAWA